MALHPLRRLGKIARVIVATYQSASGGGAGMMRRLEAETRAYLEGRPAEPSPLPEPYAFNVFSHNTPIGADGQNEEERKVVEETRKILAEPTLKLGVTCVRVPVLRAHTEAVTIEFADAEPSVEAARQVLS
ncbi:MAG: aspartate-semialdehyde dehydrogenase, partial [Armatimonadota bacterium]